MIFQDFYVDMSKDNKSWAYKDLTNDGQCFPGGSVVNRICLPLQETQEMKVQSLGWEDSLE